MINTQQPKSLTTEERIRIDTQFIADYRAGLFPELNPDPFTIEHEWMKVPARPTEAAIELLSTQLRSEWQRVGGAKLRLAILDGAMAAGSDEELFRSWADHQFLALCLSHGEDGVELIETIRTNPEFDSDIVTRVASILETIPRFGSLSLDQRIAAAMLAIDSLKTKNP
jgi:hypothetical protein